MDSIVRHKQGFIKKSVNATHWRIVTLCLILRLSTYLLTYLLTSLSLQRLRRTGAQHTSRLIV